GLVQRRGVHVQTDRLELVLFRAGGDVPPQLVPVGRSLKADLQLVDAAVLVAVPDGEQRRGEPLLNQQELGPAAQPGDEQQADDDEGRQQGHQLVVQHHAQQGADAGHEAQPADQQEDAPVGQPVPQQDVVQVAAVGGVDAAAGELAADDGGGRVQDRDDQE